MFASNLFFPVNVWGGEGYYLKLKSVYDDDDDDGIWIDFWTEQKKNVYFYLRNETKRNEIAKKNT